MEMVRCIQNQYLQLMKYKDVPFGMATFSVRSTFETEMLSKGNGEKESKKKFIQN